MTEEQFKVLCEVCDQLLVAPDSSIERVAIPWLHVIRAHPTFLEGYKDIFSFQSGETKRYIRNFASMLHHLIKAIFKGKHHWHCSSQVTLRSDVLIVSHFVNKQFTGQESDFYFGVVANELAMQGINATLALINYTNTSPSRLVKRWSKAKVPRVIFSEVLSLAKELELYRRAFTEAFHLKSFSSRTISDLVRRVSSRAASEAASGGTVSALRLGEQIKELVNHLRPSAILITYEGHSWERIAFVAARSVSPHIHCIGYQHSALFNLQYAVQRRLSDVYNPNVILTSGSISHSQLIKNPQLNDVRIEVLGSNRFVARLAPNLVQGLSRNTACLVLPEGFISECNILFSFSLQCAIQMPDMKFIWRLHPNMSFETLIHQNPEFRELPSNIDLSVNSLVEDIARSKWALYRGSTAIVTAAVSGLQPVYLHQKGDITIDTLSEIAGLHSMVIEPDDFRILVKDFEVMDTSSITEQIQNYCEQMFTPLNSDVLSTNIMIAKGDMKGVK